MKITRYKVHVADLPLVHGYTIARKTITTTVNVLLELATDTGLTGWGCAAPSDDVTGETTDMSEAALRGALRPFVDGIDVPADPASIAETALGLVPECPAARAAVDIALWDLAAQAAGQPLARYWGGEPGRIDTSVTIGICSTDQTLSEARDWLAKGFHILKVKTGSDVEADIERMRLLYEEIPQGTVVRVDANQGYSLEDARRFLSATSGLGIEMMEQPLPQQDIDGMAKLTAESDVPVVADESVLSLADCRRVVDRRAAHGINIKLMKCGGPSVARMMHDYAHANGVSLMLGCNDESRISIAAGLHLARAMPGLKYADLDGHMDLAGDPATGGFSEVDGVINTSADPGLGVTVVT